MREQVQGRERFPSLGTAGTSTEVGVCMWWTQRPAGCHHTGVGVQDT